MEMKNLLESEWEKLDVALVRCGRERERMCGIERERGSVVEREGEAVW